MYIDCFGALIVGQCGFGDMISHSVKFSLNVGGLIKVEMPSKLLWFGASGVIIFQGTWSGFIVQTQDFHIHFLMGIYCMANRTNLAIYTIFGLPMETHLEDLL